MLGSIDDLVVGDRVWAPFSESLYALHRIEKRRKDKGRGFDIYYHFYPVTPTYLINRKLVKTKGFAMGKHHVVDKLRRKTFIIKKHGEGMVI